MCYKCDTKRSAIAAELRLALDPTTPPEKLPWKLGPYELPVRAAAIQTVKDFHALALWNSFGDMGLPADSPIFVGAIKRVLETVNNVIEGLPDNELGRLVFFEHAYSTLIELSLSALTTKLMTLDDKGYYQMPEGVGREILWLFPTGDILTALIKKEEPLMGGAAVKRKPSNPPTEPIKKEEPQITDLGGGAKFASFATFEDLVELMESGGLNRPPTK
jgi:hypothetical protein